MAEYNPNDAESDDDSVVGDDFDCSDINYHEPALRPNTIGNIDSMAYSLEKGQTNIRSRPTMTRYEYVRLRGMRLTQLERGAQPLVQWYNPPKNGSTIFEAIFEAEMEQKRIPYIIKRVFPDGQAVYIRAKNLDAERWLTYNA